MDASAYQRLIAPTLRRKWIVCVDVAAGSTTTVQALRDIGAPRPLVLAGSRGTGELPDTASAEMVILGTTADTMLGGIRAYHEALRHLPEPVLQQIDAWDPAGEAVVMTSFLDSEVAIGGRPSWGARPAEWLLLEDKTTVDALWDAAGVTRAPMEIVDASADLLVAAAKRLDQGAGTVWTADNAEGWHGGAEYSRLVTDPGTAASAAHFMEGAARRVRVMPFLEGVPCAIHGLVFPDYVTAFRPAEMLVFRVPGSNRLRYGGVSTTWDPTPTRREEMRTVARRVGAHLRDVAGFRGAFTVDGVMTAEGFRPTELNPRFGAGLSVIGRSSGVPLLALSRMLIAGVEAAYRPADLERIVVEAADATRVLGGLTPLWHKVSETIERRLLVDYAGSVEAATDGGGNAALSIGPASHGGIVRFQVDDGSAPAGLRAAPVMVGALALADEWWDAGIGELIPAADR